MIALPKNAHLWLPGLLRHRWHAARERDVHGGHVMLAIADHYEPFHGGVSRRQAGERVERWHSDYRRTLGDLRDADGRMPQHTFFYPAEQYDAAHAEKLAELVEWDCGEVEVHLHHDHDTSANLRRTLLRFVDVLSTRHALLTRHPDGTTAYGFVHGNWALDNARPDGRHCGVNDELTVLKHTGCYADFTLPGVPDASQTRTVNAIYYAVDDPKQPRSHDAGVVARVGQRAPVDGLLMIQGPLVLDWTRRRFGVLPGIESATLNNSPGHLPDPRRVPLWLRASVRVYGRPDWYFVKLHTHGAHEWNARMLLGPQMRRFHVALQEEMRRTNMQLHYVTAREMANLVRAAEDGASGNPAAYRDYWLPPPARRSAVPSEDWSQEHPAVGNERHEHAQ